VRAGHRAAQQLVHDGLRTGSGLPAVEVRFTVLPANAASAPILDADSGDTVHHCTTAGPPDTAVPYQAIVCVDINTGANSSLPWAAP
jgi:hypothetical protein